MPQTAPNADVNLLPQEEISQKPVNKFVIWALSFGRYIVIFTEAIVLIVFLARFKLDTEILDLKQQMQAKAQLIGSLKGFEDEFLAIQVKIKTVEVLAEQKSNNAELFALLEEKMAQDMTLGSLSNREGSIEIVGLAQEYSSVTQLAGDLKKDPQFTQVTLASLGRVREKGSEETEEVGKIQFTIQANFTQSIGLATGTDETSVPAGTTSDEGSMVNPPEAD